MDIGVGKQKSVPQNLRGTICFPGTINKREREGAELPGSSSPWFRALGLREKSLSLKGRCSPVCTLGVKAPWGIGLSTAAFYRTSLEALRPLGAARKTKLQSRYNPQSL